MKHTVLALRRPVTTVVVFVALAMALFFIAFAVGFSSTMASLVVATFVIGCVLLGWRGRRGDQRTCRQSAQCKNNDGYLGGHRFCITCA